MIDDLVIKGVTEPYRMFTSRAEYRLALREDNADLRLSNKGFELGLLQEQYFKLFKEKKKKITSLYCLLNKNKINPSKFVQRELKNYSKSNLKSTSSLSKLLKRPGIDINIIKKSQYLNGNIHWQFFSNAVCEQAEIQIKYEGYLKRQTNELKFIKLLDKIKIPSNILYSKVPGLSKETIEVLENSKPQTLGQANRVSGITPAAITILRVFIKSKKTFFFDA